MLAGQRLADLREQIVTHHVVANIDRGGVAFGVGAAMAFDDDTIETEKDAAVGFARVHLIGEAAKCIACEQITKLAPDRPRHGTLEMLSELARGALRRLQRYVARKPFSHHHVHGSLAYVIAF